MKIVNMTHTEPLNITEPLEFSDYVGQDKAKERISRMINTHLLNGNPLRLLVTGPAGQGKSAIVKIIANNINGAYARMFCDNGVSKNDICQILSSLKVGSVLHLEEAHALSRTTQEVLYDVIDTGSIPAPGETKPSSHQRENVNPFTLIVTTNNPGKLLRPLKSRLLHVELEDYSGEHLKLIVERYLNDKKIESEASLQIVEASQKNMRNLQNLLRELFLYFPEENNFEIEHVEEMLNLRNVGSLGLNGSQKKYLKFLASQPDNTSKMTYIAGKLGLDQKYIREDIEAYLLDLSLLVLNNSVRRLSYKAINLIENGEIDLS